MQVAPNTFSHLRAVLFCDLCNIRTKIGFLNPSPLSAWGHRTLCQKTVGEESRFVATIALGGVDDTGNIIQLAGKQLQAKPPNPYISVTLPLAGPDIVSLEARFGHVLRHLFVFSGKSPKQH
jgi:hypothetical protein